MAYNICAPASMSTRIFLSLIARRKPISDSRRPNYRQQQNSYDYVVAEGMRAPQRWYEQVQEGHASHLISTAK